MGAHTVFVLKAELLVKLPGKEVEMLARMLDYFSHIDGVKPKYLDVKALERFQTGSGMERFRLSFART